MTTSADEAVGRVVLAGAGQMGGALLRAWIDAGIPASQLSVIDPRPSADLTARLNAAGILLEVPDSALEAADVLVLALKPQALEDAAPALRQLASPTTLLLSVVAGKTIADLRRSFPGVGTVARAMPNTPAAVRQGITGVALEPLASPAQRDTIETLLQAVGRVEWLQDEALIDAVTAVSGSGPAYVFFFVECLARAGVDLGLEPAMSLRLARATIEGAGALLAARSGDDPAELRRNVTSPGGTTAAALDVLMRSDALVALVAEAARAARRRAGELAG